MRGENKGIHARVLGINSRLCHRLNLVVSNAATSSKYSITWFGVVQRIYVLFSASVHRCDTLKNHVTSLQLKPLSTTRWENRIDSLKPIRYQIKEVYNALIEISASLLTDIGTKHEEDLLVNKLTDFQFLISIVVWYDLLFQINIVSKSMQSFIL